MYMQTNFNESQTRINLMRAFAGECQSQNRYNIAAQKFSDGNCEVLARVMRFTANQEEQHAKVFFDLLGDSAGELIKIEADFPADAFTDLQDLIDSAIKGEEREASMVYTDFAKVAAEEGFPDIQAKFKMIAEVEESHKKRFEYYASLLRSDTLFRTENNEQVWICLNCGHIHVGTEPPKQCPVCSVDMSYYVREGEAPFSMCGTL